MVFFEHNRRLPRLHRLDLRHRDRKRYRNFKLNIYSNFRKIKFVNILQELVGVLTCLGYFWNINNVVMGLSLLSWANSIGDFVADYSLAKAGRARTAV